MEQIKKPKITKEIKNWNNDFIEFFTEEEVVFNKKQSEDQQNDIQKESIANAA